MQLPVRIDTFFDVNGRFEVHFDERGFVGEIIVDGDRKSKRDRHLGTRLNAITQLHILIFVPYNEKPKH